MKRNGKTKDRFLLYKMVFLTGVFLALSACGINLPPEANAGANRTAMVGEKVELSGKASWDPNGDELSFQWSLNATPDGSESELEREDGMQTAFTPDKAGHYIVQLVVNDGESYSSRDLVTIVAKLEGDVLDPDQNIVGHYGAGNQECVECHNGSAARGKGFAHVNSTDMCISCHFEFNTAFQRVPADNWQPKLVDHIQVIGTCENCHAGPQSHINVGVVTLCLVCHDTRTWSQPVQALPRFAGGPGSPVPPRPGFSLDHAGIIEGCGNCHNGVTALGKTASHIASTVKCEACHSIISWLPVRSLDHTQVIGDCAGCHNGMVAVGKTALHVASSNQCGACHSAVIWSPVIIVDHTQVTGSCRSCHVPPVSHIPFQGECSDCHVTSTWLEMVKQ